MKKSVFFLGITSLSLSVAAIAVSALAPALKTQKAFGSNPVEWSHYSAVEATFDDVGIKEYWVSCASHEHQFTAPTGDVHITDKGAPSRSFIDSLASNDDRLIAKYARGFNFDDGVNPYITNKSGFNSLSIIDGEGVGGSKCLRASRTTAGDSFLRISKPYLDAVFADPSVKALSFAAKASAPTNNFRHISVDKSYVNDNNDIISCFEINNANWGITTTYKTFYLTRGVYSQINMSNGNLDWFVKFGVGTVLPQYVDLDDFKICTTDYFDYTYNGLENGYWSGTELKDPVVNQRLFYASGHVANMGFDYGVKTEGVRSFKMDKTYDETAKNGYVAFYLGAGMNALLKDGDYISFDLYGTTALNASNRAISSGRDHAFLSQNFPANKWVTIKMSHEEITDDGRFLIFQGSATGTYYFDNIRVNHAKRSFEDHTYISKIGDYVNVTHYEIADKSASDALRDSVQDEIFIFEWGFVKGCELSTEHASEGSYSLKCTMSGDGPIRVSTQWKKFFMGDTGTLSFDVYSDDVTFSGIFAGVERGKWCTVTLAKTDINDNGRICSGGLSTGIIYFDNIVVTA